MTKDARENLSVLLIDNFDSFSFNLVDELDKRGANVHVWRNDIAAAAALELLLALPAPHLLVLSPGPGAPADAGCCIELIRLAEGRVPVFGVCLGHQAIVEAYGGKVGYAGEVVHGKTAKVAHDGSGLFEALPSPMYAARYHSLAATTMPDVLRATAHTRGAGRDIVMALQHRTAPTAGVQFHPESILTPLGGLLWEAVIRWAKACHPAAQTQP